MFFKQKQFFNPQYNTIFDSLNARKASKQELSSHFIMSKSVAISNYFWGIMEWSIFIPRKPEADASAFE
jgi:hypothetical protein